MNDGSIPLSCFRFSVLAAWLKFDIAHCYHFTHNNFDSEAPAAPHVLDTSHEHLVIYIMQQQHSNTSKCSPHTWLWTRRCTGFTQEVSYTYRLTHTHCISVEWPNMYQCVHVHSNSPRQVRTASGGCLCRARHSGGIWGFLCFIPSLSCYCILSIVSIRDLLSLACLTSWPAAKKVSGRESCHSH